MCGSFFLAAASLQACVFESEVCCIFIHYILIKGFIQRIRMKSVPQAVSSSDKCFFCNHGTDSNLTKENCLSKCVVVK